MFTQKFGKDLAQWKKTRPEYATLLAAIKGTTFEPGEPVGDAILERADDAGCMVDEVCELRNLHTRASAATTRERAAKFKALSQEVSTLTEQISEAEKTRAIAKTLIEQGEAEGQLYDLVEKRQRLNLALADAQVAFACLTAATEAGLA
jgi:hypothetical protein